jgi:probable HAF family extracellular repeat protein
MRYAKPFIAMTLFVTLAIAVGLAAENKPQQESNQRHHYKLVILGTLGGPQSYGDAGHGAANINNRGTAVGVADTSAADPFYPNFNPLLSGLIGSYPFIYHAFTTRGGAIVDLGGLPGGYNSVGSFITENGLVTGEALNGSMDPITGWPAEDPVLWKNGQIINLGSLGGYEGQSGRANSNGQVTGFTTNVVPDPFSIIYFFFAGFSNGTQTRAFLWDERSGMQDIGTLGGPDAVAALINERGQIAGASYTNDIPNPTTGIPTQDPFLWENGTMTDLGSLGGTSAFSEGLNNRGQVVGQSNLAGDQTAHPFLWDKGTLTDLGTLGGPCGDSAGINEDDAVVGLADIAGVPCGVQSHAFLWTSKTGMTDLGTVGADCFSGAFGINNKNQVVGQSISCDGNAAEAFLWENGDMIDLNVFVPPGSDLTLTEVEEINDRGEMFGIGTLANGKDRAFLLIPCDENHPGVEGCDYSMVEAGATVTGISSVPVTRRTTANQSNPWLRGAANPMLRPFGRSASYWHRGVGPQPPK